ncbi:hypothetical protein H0H81_007196 [Sphagnurus paluster]|uniref:Uncharacterized protein n=1 Tax=Sphagnurus paluster TaxID=117069 RepID=A0A9P7KKL6_9AGAR|nr:hypothetical protein H0H81_007196 [Sphagnurus paluster]
MAFSEKNETSYRPTNDDCLMRSVTLPNFCKVCIEGLWLSLLRRVNLVDSVKEGCKQTFPEGGSGTAGWVKTIDLELIPLAQFRDRVVDDESYTIKWRKGRTILKDFTNKTRIEIADVEALGTYFVSVDFATPEVRVDKDRRLSMNFAYQVKDTCATLAR